MGVAPPLTEQQQPHAAVSSGPVGQGGTAGGSDEDGAGPWVKTLLWLECRAEDVLECLYGEQGKWGRCEP